MRDDAGLRTGRDGGRRAEAGGAASLVVCALWQSPAERGSHGTATKRTAEGAASPLTLGPMARASATAARAAFRGC